MHLLHSFRVYFCIFCTRFECIFASSALVSSVVLHLLHSFRVYFCIFCTRFECIFASSALVSSLVVHVLHSFRVYFCIFSTRFECSFITVFRSQAEYRQFSLIDWRQDCQHLTPLLKLHSKRVEMLENYTRNE